MKIAGGILGALLLVGGIWVRLNLVRVQGGAMSPSLQDQDILFVKRSGFDPAKLTRGEIVMYKANLPGYAEVEAVARIVGLPGETIKISDGKVWLNGTRLPEEYLGLGTETRIKKGQADEVTLGGREYFVMGDDRVVSIEGDSREFGPIPAEKISGKVSAIVWKNLTNYD